MEEIMTIKKLLYRLYRLDWMRRISTERMMDFLKTYYEDSKMDTEPTTPEEVLEEFGFDGELYVSYEEFLESEYLDKDYIKGLLNNDDLYNEYLADLAV